jgi:scyllo-inositol 2-dehydrogenase (NADP+)
VVRSLDELLAIPEIRLVVITTPNPSHFELAKQCLLNGRDVVIDKPITPTSAEAVALAQLAREQGRLLTVYQNRRWDGDFQTVRKLVESKVLGRLVLYESHYDRYRIELKPNAWRERDEPGSGVFFDLGVHLIDQAMTLFGIPLDIQADIRIERDGAIVDDCFDVVLHYDRMRAVLRTTMLASAPGPRFVLHGTAGTYVSREFDPQEEALKRGETPKNNSWGVVPESAWGVLTTPGEGSASRAIPSERGDYRGFYENVRDAILGKATLAVTPEQAIDVLRALELAKESSVKKCALAWKEV